MDTVKLVDQEVVRLVAKSVAGSTLSTYRRACEAFFEFRVAVGCDCPSAIPSSSSEVAQFVAFLSIRGLAPATIASYLSGLAFWLQVNGFPRFTDDFLVRKLLAGVRRGGKSCDGRKPILWPSLKLILGALPQVCSTSFEAVLFKSAFALAFFAFLRVGEVVCGREGRHTLKTSGLRWTNLHSSRGTSEAMLVTLDSSKSDQFGRGCSILLSKSDSFAFCPVALLEAYWRVRPPGKGCLFVHFDGRPVTRRQFSVVLARAIEFIGEKGPVSSHSFRIGAATWAAMAGFSGEQIKVWGRWKSSCYQRYIRLPRSSLLNVNTF